jgi:F420-dependent oxidoreductase-like protein
MHIGLFASVGGAEGIDAVLERCRKAEADGFRTLWFANIFGYDGITLAALVGRLTNRVELGTAVVPTYPRHPAAIAQQALTAQAASGNRFALGIGLSHKLVIEDMLGLDYSKPLLHIREYLTVLSGLLSGAQTQFEGKQYRVRAAIQVPGAAAPPVIVAALGPQMLELAGKLADGTSTWMGGPKYLGERAVPTITKAAAEAGRPAPRIVAGFPVAVTNNGDAARDAAAKQFAMYGMLPSYRALLDFEGVADPSGASIIGDEADVEKQLTRLAQAGVTDLNVSPFDVPQDPGAARRTYELMSSLARAETRPWDGL